jgi:type I restriction enzyme S subunit
MVFEDIWQPIEEVVDDILDRRGVTPMKLGGDFTASGHRVISAKLIKGGRIDLSPDEMRFVGPDIYKKWMRSPLRAGDVIMTSEAPLGELAFMKEGADWCLGQRLFALRPRDGVMDGRFLYYALQTSEVRADLNSRASGTTVLGIRQAELRKVLVPVPPISEQRETAALLGAIDDRIDNLRQTNATLEAIAQALFKCWFVDFDPVCAKAEGREPEGMAPATAALFPSEFEDSELGPIPNGWRVDQIGQVVRCVGGATPSTKNEDFWVDGIHHWATPKDLSGLQAPILTATERMITDEGVARISSGLLPGGTLLMSSRAPIGYLALSAMPVAINQGFIAMPPGGLLPPSYLLFWACANMDSIKQKANGSTFMEISKSTFRPIRVCVPPAKVIEAFVVVVEPLLRRIELNELHKATLAETRDTLLPRLISGKLRLPEVEALADEVA